VLGASQRFPLFLGQQARRGHSLLGQGDHHHHHEPQHEHHPGAHQLAASLTVPARALSDGYLPAASDDYADYGYPEVVPLDGLYGAPAMMMMDPSYNFEFSSEDGAREETNSLQNVVTGSYSYRTPGGQDILVRYSAGPDTGFVVENADEVAAAVARSAGEAAPEPAVKAAPYSGEVAEAEFTAPGVDSAMNLERSYAYSYAAADQAAQQTADGEGEISGSYSYTLADGTELEVRYTAGKDGFKVENLDEVLAKAAPAEAEAGEDTLAGYQEAAPAPAPAVVVAKSAAAPLAAVEVAGDYADYEPYVHVDMPYVHEEIAAEPYVHVDMPYVHEEIEAEPYIHDEPDYVAASDPAPATYAASAPAKIGRKRVPVTKAAASVASVSPVTIEGKSFSFEAVAEDHEFSEAADAEGERTGSYSYLTPSGHEVTVQYSAGKQGFVILNPEQVLPQPVVA